MKIVHWVHFDKDKWSGLFARATELQAAEVRLGHESAFCDPMQAFAKGYEVDGVVVHPWGFAEDADVNIIESHVPSLLPEFKNKVFIPHGGPSYCAMNITEGKDASMIPSIQMIQQSDIIISQNRFHIPFWQEFTDPEKVFHVIGGVDLEKWNPKGKREKLFANRPAIVYMDMWRFMKLPFTLLRAIKRVVKELPTARLNLLNLPGNQLIFWARFCSKLGMDWLVEQYRPGRVKDPSVIYRSADIIVDPVQGGTTSGVGVEAMACGCPVVFLAGHPDVHGVAKCLDNPDAMAGAIVALWKNIDRARESARALAEQYYDVNRMAQEMIDIYTREFDIKE